MRHQVQEMLHIEQAGDAQIEDELAAYNPLIPQGKELVATVMFEIDDPTRRASVLARLGGIEDRVFLTSPGSVSGANPIRHARTPAPRARPHPSSSSDFRSPTIRLPASRSPAHR